MTTQSFTVPQEIADALLEVGCWHHEPAPEGMDVIDCTGILMGNEDLVP